jgi:hypothetical protein
MKKLIFLFAQGQEITFAVTELDEFMAGVSAMDGLYEYELRYEGEMVMVKMKGHGRRIVNEIKQIKDERI